MALIANKTKLGHKQFGEGILKSIDSDKIVVVFEKHGEKKFSSQSIIEKKLWVIEESEPDISNKPKEFNKSQMVIGTYNVHESFISSTPLLFNESYILIGQKMSAPSIHANYNLVVIGDLYCEDLSVGGSLIVIGLAELKRLFCGKDVICSGKLSINDGEIESNIIANELKSSDLQCNGNINIQTIADIKSNITIEGLLFANEGIMGKGELNATAAVAGDYIDFDGITPKNSIELSELNVSGDTLSVDTVKDNLDSLICNQLPEKIDLSSEALTDSFISTVSDISKQDIYRRCEWNYLTINLLHIMNNDSIDNLKDCLLLFYAEKFLPNEIKHCNTINKVFSSLLPLSIDKIEDLEFSANNIYDVAFAIKIVEEFGDELCNSKKELLDKIFDFMGIKYDTVKKYLIGE